MHLSYITRGIRQRRLQRIYLIFSCKTKVLYISDQNCFNAYDKRGEEGGTPPRPHVGVFSFFPTPKETGIFLETCKELFPFSKNNKKKEKILVS